MRRAMFAICVVGLVIAFAFSGCAGSKSEAKPVKMATEKREASGFKQIVLEGPGQLTIKQGKEEALRVEAGEDVIGSILSDVSNRVLTIKTEIQGGRQPNFGEIKLYVTVDELEKIVLKGAGMVKTDGQFKIDELDVMIAGAGEADLNVKGDKLTVEIPGAGRVIVQGEVDEQKVRISGVGQYEAMQLISDEADIEVSGAGSAAVNVAKKLDVKISGTGRVTYKGDPKVTQKISGRGRVDHQKTQP